MDRFLYRRVDEIKPDTGLLLLADPVHSSNSLKFKGGIQQGLAEKYVTSIDEIEARRVSPSMEKEAFSTWILFKCLNSIRFVDRGISDPEFLKSVGEDVKKVLELREDDGLGSWIRFSKPDEMTCEGVYLGGKGRSIEFNAFDLCKFAFAYLRIYRGFS